MRKEVMIISALLFAAIAMALLPSYVATTGSVTVTDACGSGRVSAGEECELPSTANNEFCTQTTGGSDCLGTKVNTRDTQGDCSTTCTCIEDESVYLCVQDFCGATCDRDEHCPDSECEETFNDFCDGAMLTEYDSDKVLDSTTVSDSTANTCNTDTCGCSANPVSCDAPGTNTYCVEGVCGAECDEDIDCPTFLSGDTCFFDGLCETGSSCSCDYIEEFCPAPGTIDNGDCYYGTQSCDDIDGCTLDTCTLGLDQICDPSLGCFTTTTTTTSTTTTTMATTTTTSTTTTTLAPTTTTTTLSPTTTTTLPPTTTTTTLLPTTTTTIPTG